MLEESLLLWAELHYPFGSIFQQDDTLEHTAGHTKEFFMEEDMLGMGWPARYVDMNAIENA